MQAVVMISYWVYFVSSLKSIKNLLISPGSYSVQGTTFYVQSKNISNAYKLLLLCELCDTTPHTNLILHQCNSHIWNIFIYLFKLYRKPIRNWIIVVYNHICTAHINMYVYVCEITQIQSADDNCLVYTFIWEKTNHNVPFTIYLELNH